ncbi:kelch-like protein 12 [Saccoglossus kowalevskii]|uniref:Kelch-like protein diablo-like n=1 Tax=Saccoglossus kowalevskii TaxID=10224 RepID=A0ABM0MWA6_SACKO|nr:PREDICTED: kelch-like protein diablo-like [Saccoglossus kowalevskii]
MDDPNQAGGGEMFPDAGGSGNETKRTTVQDEVVSSTDMDQYRVLQLQRHAVSMLSFMHGLRERAELCDVTLSVKGKCFPAHRIVLAACSPYFNAMFTSEVREKGETVIVLQDLEPNAVEAIINFAYTADVHVSEDNVQALLKASSLLQLQTVQTACCEFLESQLDPSNCLGIRKFAELHGCFDLQTAADTYTQQHFSKVAQNEEFLQLSCDDLIGLIHRDTLNVKSEEEVYSAVVLWIKHEHESRLEELPTILEHVRLPLVTWEFLTTKVADDNLVTGSKICMKYYNEAKRFLASSFHPQLQGELNVRSLPRDSFCQAKYIYAAGGETAPGRCTISSVERYNPLIDRWTSVTPMRSIRRGVGLATLQNVLYAVGGSDGLNALNCVECFDPQTDCWRMVAPLLAHRSSVAVVTFQNHLYAFGGYDGMTSVQTAESYNPSVNEWTLLPDMNTPRSMAGVVSLGNHIYVIGGYDGANDLITVEKYNPVSKEWSSVSPMLTCRSMLGAAVLNNKIYVAGGCERALCLASVEVYDPTSDTWSLACPMNRPRNGVGVAAVGNRLYALGGYDGMDYLNTVEVYNVVKDQWTEVASMETCRRRFGCCS